MSLGILNNISAIYAENYLNLTQADLQKTLEQLSSGSRLNTGADDAAGLAVVSGLHANEAALTQSAQNATNGIGLLQTADSSLAQVTNLLTRAVTLATESANGTLNAAQTSSANSEYTQILTEIGNIGSATNFNGNQVFSSSGQTLFVSDGTATGANQFIDTVGVLTTASVGQSTPTGTVTTTAITNPTPTASTVNTATAATIGFDSATDTFTGDLSVQLGSGTAYTTSYAGLTSAQVLAALQSSTTLQSEGISAAINGAGTLITLTGPSNGQGGSLALTSTGTPLADDTTTTAAVLTDTTAAVNGASVASFTLGAATNTLGGTLSLQVTGGATNTITVAPGTTGTELAAQINANTNFQAAQVSATFTASTGVLAISGPAGAGGADNLVLTGTSLDQTTVLGSGPGVDFTSSAVNSLTYATAPTVLTTLTAAIADVAYQRGVLGAEVNTLTAASTVASAENVNLTSASSAIESTDYGQATSDLAKYEVLSQTGISALAQSNTVQQEILKLLQ
jgi:flagellin